MAESAPLSPGAVAQAALAPIRPEGYFGGIRLLAADARVVSLLINDARTRTMERLFGIPRDQPSGLATLIALGLLTEALRTHAPSPPTRPSLIGLAFGFGGVREAAYDVAGPWARESSYFGTLLAIALAGATAGTVARRSVRGVKGLSHGAYAEFHHRYGHLIRPNRRRRAGAEPGSRESGTLPISDM